VTSLVFRLRETFCSCEPIYEFIWPAESMICSTFCDLECYLPTFHLRFLLFFTQQKLRETKFCSQSARWEYAHPPRGFFFDPVLTGPLTLIPSLPPPTPDISSFGADSPPLLQRLSFFFLSDPLQTTRKKRATLSPIPSFCFFTILFPSFSDFYPPTLYFVICRLLNTFLFPPGFPVFYPLPSSVGLCFETVSPQTSCLALPFSPPPTCTSPSFFLRVGFRCDFGLLSALFRFLWCRCPAFDPFPSRLLLTTRLGQLLTPHLRCCFFFPPHKGLDFALQSFPRSLVSSILQYFAV